MDEKLKRLYETMVNDGYELPGYDQFVSDMQDENNLSKMYSTLSGDGYELPSEDQFKTDMGFKKKDSVSSDLLSLYTEGDRSRALSLKEEKDKFLTNKLAQKSDSLKQIYLNDEIVNNAMTKAQQAVSPHLEVLSQEYQSKIDGGEMSMIEAEVEMRGRMEEIYADALNSDEEYASAREDYTRELTEVMSEEERKYDKAKIEVNRPELFKGDGLLPSAYNAISYAIPSAFKGKHASSSNQAMRELEEELADFEAKVQEQGLSNEDLQPYGSPMTGAVERVAGYIDYFTGKTETPTENLTVAARRKQLQDSIDFYKGDQIKKLSEAIDLNEKLATVEIPPDVTDGVTFTEFKQMLGSQLPQVATSIVMPVAGSYVQEAGGNYVDNVVAVAAKNNDVSPGEVTSEQLEEVLNSDQAEEILDKSMLAGGVSGGLDLIGLGSMAKTLKPLIKGVVKQSAKETAKGQLKQTFKNYASGIITEGLTESTQGMVSDYAQSSILDEEFNVNVNQALNEAAIGSITAAAIGSPGAVRSTVRSYSNNAQKISRAEAKKSIENATKESELKNFRVQNDPIVQEELTSKLEELKRQVKEEVEAEDLASQQENTDIADDGGNNNIEGQPEQSVSEVSGVDEGTKPTGRPGDPEVDRAELEAIESRDFVEEGNLGNAIEANKGNPIQMLVGGKGVGIDLGDAKKKLKNLSDKTFKMRGILPQGVFDAKVAKENRIGVEINKARNAASDLKRALPKDSDPKRLKVINAALGGNKIAREQLSDAELDAVDDMRSHITSMSKKLIDEGVVSGDMAATVDANMDTYINRSYQVFDDPKWAKNVPDAIVSRYENYLRKAFPDISDQEVQGEINSILSSEGGPMSFVNKDQLGKKTLDIIKRRKTMPTELRELMGEYKDPFVNYTKSVNKMAQLIENHKFLREVRDMGEGVFLFDKKTGDHYVKIEGGETKSPLTGDKTYYTTPELAEVFNGMQAKDLPNYFKHYMKVVGLAKYSKTIASPITHARNVAGNFYFVMANSHYNVGKFKKAIGETRVELMVPPKNKKGVEASRKYYQRLIELGVVDSDINTGEIKDVMRDAIGKENAFESLMDVSAKKNIVNKAAKVATKLYSAEDNVFKIYAFENELARYKKAMPDATDAEVEQVAANIVRNTYPNYGLVTETVKALRRNPLVGSFVAFPAEVIRTTYQTAKQAVTEVSSENPEVRRIGAKRMAGMMSAAGAGFAISAMSNMLSAGATEEEEEAVRVLATPPWSENSELALLNIDGDEVVYVDISATDPSAYYKGALMAAMRGDDWEDKFFDSAGELLMPFIGEDLVVARILDVARNSEGTSGRNIYNESDSRAKQAQDAASHLLGVLTPGAVDQIERIYKSQVDEDGNTYGRKYNPKDEMIALMGIRTTRQNKAKSFQFKVYDFKKRLTDVDRIAREDPAAANESRKKLINDMNKIYEAGLTLGVSRREMMKMMKKARVNNRVIREIRTNKHDEYDVE